MKAILKFSVNKIEREDSFTKENSIKINTVYTVVVVENMAVEHWVKKMWASKQLGCQRDECAQWINSGIFLRHAFWDKTPLLSCAIRAVIIIRINIFKLFGIYPAKEIFAPLQKDNSSKTLNHSFIVTGCTSSEAIISYYLVSGI